MAKHKDASKFLGTGDASKTADKIKKRKAQMKKAIPSKKKKASPKKDVGGKTTAKSIPGIQKSKKKGDKELEALRKKQKDRVKVLKRKK